MSNKCIICGIGKESKVPLISRIADHNQKVCLFHASDDELKHNDWNTKKFSDFIARVENWSEINPRVRGHPIICSFNLEGDFDYEIDLSGFNIIQNFTIENSNFREALNLNGCNFSKEVRVKNCNFNQDLLFSSRCHGKTYIHDNAFLKDAHFSDSLFNNVCVIFDNFFNLYASFRNITCNEYFWSVGNTFNGYVNFTKASFERESFIEGCKFLKVNTHDEVQYKSKVSFRDSIFYWAPTFFEAKFTANLEVSPKQFYDFKSQDAYHSYKSMRHIFSGKEERVFEADFYFLEQASLTRSRNDWLEKLIGFSYEIFSGYGTNILRSLTSFFIFQLIFWLYYLFESGNIDSSSCLLFRQIFTPFSVWSSIEICSFKTDLTFNLISSFHSIITIIVIAFFLFGLRWRYKNY